MLSKKYYIKFAEMIAERNEAAESEELIVHALTPKRAYLSALYAVAYDMAAVFAQDNPNFDRERFLKACGLS